jgi:hypothetical protein
MSRDTSKLLRGTFDLLVLEALATQPLHGFGLSQGIEVRTRNELEIVDSALYKALHRLEGDRCIASEWGVSENNRKSEVLLAHAEGPTGAAGRDGDLEAVCGGGIGRARDSLTTVSERYHSERAQRVEESLSVPTEISIRTP